MTNELEYHILKSHTASVNCLAFFNKDESFISGGDDNALYGWSVKEKSSILKLRGHEAPVTSCCALRSNSWIVSGSWDRSAKLWDSEKQQCLWSFLFGSLVLGTCINDKGTLLTVCCDDKKASLIDLKSYQEVAVFKDHTESVTCASMHGPTVVTGSMDKTVKVYDLRTKACLLNLTGHESVVSSVHLSPDQFKLASASWDKSVRIWDLHAGTFRKQGPILMYDHEGCVSSCEFTQDNNKVVSAGFDKQVIIWDARQYKQQHTIRAHGSWINDARISASGNWLITASKDRTIRLWNLEGTDKLPVVLYNKLEMGYKFQVCENCNNTFKVEEQDLVEISQAVTKCVYCRMRISDTTIAKATSDTENTVPGQGKVSPIPEQISDTLKLGAEGALSTEEVIPSDENVSSAGDTNLFC